MEWGKAANFLFRQGRVIDPQQGKDTIADVLILEGRLAEIRPQIQVSRDRTSELQEYDMTGKWIVPGLIDMHVHLREPGEEYKETIASGTQAAVAGGYVAVACMPNTQPVNDSAAVTEFILERAREEGACHVFPVGAITKGLKGENLSEIGELRASGAVAVSDDGRPVMNSLMMRRALEYARIFDMPVISHAEDIHLSQGGLMNEGATSTLLGLRGIPGAAEEVMIARDLILAELTRSRVHIAHVSTSGSVRLIRDAKARGVPVTAETAPHYFTLTDEELMTFDPLFKVNPPIRRAEDVAAIKEGLRDGTLDAVATDHAPHSVLEKDTEFEFAANGMIGLESALPLILSLVREGILAPTEAIAKVTCNPARILGAPLGTLQTDTLTDLTVIDPEQTYTLDVNEFHSKSRNCPFHGRRMQGRALMTIVRGKVAFSRMSQ
ncbi:dihydroorotase [Desulforhabdus amnigena]|jgi:dihydroorotase|uniref:Dihydroorotase n=1 Tax=Desulforhabdus amnigena TaxID=40218 RepID=A0A9W6FWQ3_9BACT|nr:dihydroorotase [Desulforhabdus amnigena]NLJ28314.1 dihydroorotase [Deltaproteobacteria bacterium]GLI36232.1 dihydroorotase [Desulforhabdus amnigena]